MQDSTLSFSKMRTNLFFQEESHLCESERVDLNRQMFFVVLPEDFYRGRKTMVCIYNQNRNIT